MVSKKSRPATGAGGPAAGPNGSSGTKRDRRTKAQIAQLDAQICTIAAEGRPLSIRHIFYRCTDPRLPEPLEKSERGYRAVKRRCTALRRSEALPYGWISDATRRGHHVETFEDAGDLIAAFAGLYRVDLWKNAPVYCEVWTESRSIAGVIERDCRDLGVNLYPCGGFASLALAYEGATGIRHAAAGRPVRIIYVGDYDPAGVLIDKKVMEELRGHLPELELQEVRIAITAEQAAVLPSKPRKRGDQRRLDIQETVEAEAMPVDELRRLLRATVEGFLPEGVLARAQEIEKSEREGLRRLGVLTSNFGMVDSLWALEGLKELRPPDPSE